MPAYAHYRQKILSLNRRQEATVGFAPSGLISYAVLMYEHVLEYTYGAVWQSDTGCNVALRFVIRVASLTTRCLLPPRASRTEVQRVSFVGSTNEDCHPHPLCNLQNLHAVPPYK